MTKINVIKLAQPGTFTDSLTEGHCYRVHGMGRNEPSRLT